MRHNYTYAAFGTLINTDNETKNSYLFAGEQLDLNLEEYYLRQRYYSPHSGIFNRRDSYEGDRENPTTMHKYLYTNSNPVNGIDPSGLETIVYVHSGAHWYGHAAIDVDGTVYTFGRYQTSNTTSGGLNGDGYLYKVRREDYFVNRGFTSSRDTVDRYQLHLSEQEESQVINFYTTLYNRGRIGNENYHGYIGSVIGEYRFVAGANNCTTLIQDSLPNQGIMLYGAADEFSPVQYGRLLWNASLINPNAITQLSSHQPSELQGREMAVGNVFELGLYVIDSYLGSAFEELAGWNWSSSFGF
jgi:RHS repeat-associated protein